MLPVGLEVTDAERESTPHRARSQPRRRKSRNWKCSVTEQRDRHAASTTLVDPAVRTPRSRNPGEGRTSPPAPRLAANEAERQRRRSAGGGGPSPGASLTRAGADQRRAGRLRHRRRRLRDHRRKRRRLARHPGRLAPVSADEHARSSTRRSRKCSGPDEPDALAPGAPALRKNLSFNLPPGLLGNVNAADAVLGRRLLLAGWHGRRHAQPAARRARRSASRRSRSSAEPVGYITLAVPLFNLEPAPGEPARFGFEAEAVPVVLDTSRAHRRRLRRHRRRQQRDRGRAGARRRR